MQTGKVYAAVTPMKKLRTQTCSQHQQPQVSPGTPSTSPQWSHTVPTCLLVIAKFCSTFSTSVSLCSTSKAWSKVLALSLGQAKLLSTWEKQQCNSCLILSNSSSESERGKLRSCLLKKIKKPFFQWFRQYCIKCKRQAHKHFTQQWLSYFVYSVYQLVIPHTAVNCSTCTTYPYGYLKFCIQSLLDCKTSFSKENIFGIF